MTTRSGSFAFVHGDGVKDISLRVPDAREAYRQAVQRGARGIMEPKWVEDEWGKVELASIATYGDVVHTFVNRSGYEGAYLPGYVAVDSGPEPSDVGLLAIDHVVGNVELGRMEHWVEFYERVFGMTEMLHFSDKDISTEYSALMSKVMTDGQGKIKFPINEPAEGKRKSQIEEYLEFNHGPGSQHIALTSTNIVETVEALKRRGVRLPLDSRRVLRGDAGPRRHDRRVVGRPAAAQDPGRPRRRRLPAPDLHEDRAGPSDALLRGDRAPRRARVRRRELQGALRGDRARAGAARQSLARARKRAGVGAGSRRGPTSLLCRLPRMGIGALLVILGIIVLIVWNIWIGIILILIGLLFGGFRRGSWY